jgi:hypothetical protein
VWTFAGRTTTCAAGIQYIAAGGISSLPFGNGVTETHNSNNPLEHHYVGRSRTANTPISLSRGSCLGHAAVIAEQFQPLVDGRPFVEGPGSEHRHSHVRLRERSHPSAEDGYGVQCRHPILSAWRWLIPASAADGYDLRRRFDTTLVSIRKKDGHLRLVLADGL